MLLEVALFEKAVKTWFKRVEAALEEAFTKDSC